MTEILLFVIFLQLCVIINILSKVEKYLTSPPE